MELRHLQYLVAVAEEGSFTRAAARVHVAQPGVSAQIQQLEREVGHRLLDRSGRSVRLTAAGAAVLPHARAALAAVARMRSVADELTGLLRGHLTIGTITSINSDRLDLPAFLAEFHRDHPAIEITLTTDDSEGLIASLRNGQLDLAVLGLGRGSPPGLDVHVITSERLVVAVAPEHPLARRATVTLSGLVRYPLICLPRGTAIRSSVEAACAGAGLTPDIRFEAADPRVLAELAARGLGAAVVPQSITDARRSRLRAVAITRPALHGRIALAWQPNEATSAAARELIRRARAVPGVRNSSA
jgi:DNA-binding transcriptional LysR family regulator